MAKKTEILKKSSERNIKPSGRVPLGIKDFDNLINGGFIKKSTNLVVGRAGAGKTIFAIEFLVNGIINYGEPGVYITFEEKKEKLYNDMIEFGWDLKKLENDGKFAFLEYTPEQVKKVLIEGGGIVESLITKMKAKRIVIDSISSFALLYQDELTRKEAALALIALIDNWGCTAVLTSEETVIEYGNTISTALEFEVDSIILLYYTKVKSARVRAMEILKMRGTKHTNKTFEFSINENGMYVNPKKTVIL
ncbi:MAG TPA: ATPase domain-containing protein [Candidatus Nanoarchaeia archaeon]|nr:ATPase domain-containing protein [Candidatus Nanoarchaeia archaeon]